MDFRNDVVSYFENDFGIITDAHHHEVATAGQCEINMLYDSLYTIVIQCENNIDTPYGDLG